MDVFTDRQFGGNPLAVFPDSAGLTDAQMQDIAKEMNLSETTFVLPAERTDCDVAVRIFTPRTELPFAGHPTIGTASVLLTDSARNEIALEEAVGRIPVTVSRNGDPPLLYMTVPAAEFGAVFENRAEFAAAIGVAETELLADAPIQVVSSGVAHVYIPLASAQAVDSCRLDLPKLLRAFGSHEPLAVFVTAPTTKSDRLYSRMFAPHTVGIAEDPATGSASGPLGAYLLEHDLVRGDGRIDIVSEQGTKMRRQSFIHVSVEHEGKTISRLRVGGTVVPVLRGVLNLRA